MSYQGYCKSTGGDEEDEEKLEVFSGHIPKGVSITLCVLQSTERMENA